MSQLVIAIGKAVAVVFACAVLIGLVRWAKKGGTNAAMLASGMLLLFGFLLVPEQIPQQRIEEAREDKRKKGSESGDPPTDPEVGNPAA